MIPNSKTATFIYKSAISKTRERKGKVNFLLKFTMAKKTKPLLPTSREKKRYLAYEVISSARFNDATEISKAIYDAAKEFLGNLGMAKAGIIVLNDQFSQKTQRGIVRVDNKHVDDIKASFIFINSIGTHESAVRSVGASGILKKTQQKYLN